MAEQYSPQRHYGRILFLLRRDRRKEAETELKKYLRFVPENPIAHAQLAFCLGRNYDFSDNQNDEERAAMLREAETAVFLDSENAFCQYVLASSSSLAGQYAKALKAAQRAIRLEPDDAWNHYEKGFALFRLNRRGGARKAFRKVLELYPNHYDALRLLTWVENDLGHKEAAIRYADEAMKIVPTDSEIHAAKGYSMLGVRPYEDVLRTFLQALRLNPDDPWARKGAEYVESKSHLWAQLCIRIKLDFLAVPAWQRFLLLPLTILCIFLAAGGWLPEIPVAVFVVLAMFFGILAFLASLAEPQTLLFPKSKVGAPPNAAAWREYLRLILLAVISWTSLLLVIIGAMMPENEERLLHWFFSAIFAGFPMLLLTGAASVYLPLLRKYSLLTLTCILTVLGLSAYPIDSRFSYLVFVFATVYLFVARQVLRRDFMHNLSLIQKTLP